MVKIWQKTLKILADWYRACICMGVMGLFESGGVLNFGFGREVPVI